MAKAGTVFDSSISQYNIQYAPCRGLVARGFAGKRFFERVTIVFILEPKRPLTAIAPQARVAGEIEWPACAGLRPGLQRGSQPWHELVHPKHLLAALHHHDVA